MRKFFLLCVAVLVFSLVASCTWVVVDPRTPAEATATNEARAALLPTVTPEAQAPEPTVEPQVVPEEEEGVSEPEPPSQPPCLDIKGNIDTRTGAFIYYMPDADYYSRVKINEANGERWFCSEQEAVDAGWEKSSR